MTTTSASPSLPVEDSHMVPGGVGGATEETPSCHKPCNTANLSKEPSLPTCPLSQKRKLEAESAESAACQHQGSGRNVWSRRWQTPSLEGKVLSPSSSTLG